MPFVVAVGTDDGMAGTVWITMYEDVVLDAAALDSAVAEEVSAAVETSTEVVDEMGASVLDAPPALMAAQSALAAFNTAVKH